MEWFFPTRVWRRMHGEENGETGVDNEVAEQGFAGIGAWILGRNMRLRALGYESAKPTAGERATHVFLRKRTPRA